MKRSKDILQFLLGASGLHDRDACVAWLINVKFGDPKFTWKVLADNLKIAAEGCLPLGIIRPQYASKGPESNDLRLAVFYAQVTFVVLRGGKIATEKVVNHLLNPPGSSSLHQQTRDQINKHVECRHTYLQKLFNEFLTLGSPKTCKPAHCAEIYEQHLQRTLEYSMITELNIFQQYVCFAFWSWKFFDLVVSPREKPGCSEAQDSRAAAIVDGTLTACPADQNITRIKRANPDQAHEAINVKSEDGAVSPYPTRAGKNVFACTGKDPLWQPGTTRVDADVRI